MLGGDARRDGHQGGDGARARSPTAGSNRAASRQRKVSGGDRDTGADILQGHVGATGREEAINLGALHVALTDDLVKAGRKAGDLVSRIAAVGGGKGGGRPHFASGSRGDGSRLAAAREATGSIVQAWLEGS